MARTVWGVCLLLLLAGCAVAVPPDPNDPLAIGATVYARHCAVCHGANLEGQPDWQTPFANGMLKAPPHDETGHTWHHPDAYLVERIRSGTALLDPAFAAQSNMPAYGDVLSDAEIEAVILFIKSHWPAEVLEFQASRNNG